MVSGALMQSSIRRALSIRIGLLIFCISVFTGLISFTFYIYSAEEEFQSNIEQQTRHLSSSFTQQLWLFDMNATQKLSSLAVDSPEVRGLRLLDKDKELLIEKGVFDDKSSFHIINELRYEGEVLVGYIELFFINTSWERQRNSLLITGAGVVFTTVFSTFLFISFLLNRHLVKPLNDLQEDMVALKDGKFKQSNMLGYKTEIQSIIDVFNSMALTLAERERGQQLAEQQLRNSLQDLTKEIEDRKKTEENIRSLRNLLRNIIDSMPSSIVGVDIDGKVMQWNLQAEIVTGVKAEDALGRVADEVYPNLSSEMANVKKAILNRTPIINSKVANERKGQIEYFNITIYPLTTNGISGAVIRVDDITESEKKDIQFQQAQKMETVGTLAGGLAHDFNNVLGGIIGTLSIIDLKLNYHKIIPNDELAEYVDIMKQAGERATNMVSQLLAISKKQEISFKDVDLDFSIKQIMKICKNSFDKSIKLTYKESNVPLVISADSAQIEQLLLNLCVNASHAMTIMREEGHEWGGELEIAVSKVFADSKFCQRNRDALEQYYWVISITDSGVGMSPEIVTQIFTPFFTTKGEGRGTGLGLAMVYNIVKQHNGFIKVTSRLSASSQFKIYLPVSTTCKLPIQDKFQSEILIIDSGVILVVDDEEIMRMTAKNILKECGYNVTLAKNGNEAIEIYKEKQGEIALVLLDMAMPEVSGKETFIELKKIDPDIKVILASGYRHDARVDEVLQLGVKSFIQKPYTIEKLALAVKKELTSKS